MHQRPSLQARLIALLSLTTVRVGEGFISVRETKNELHRTSQLLGRFLMLIHNERVAVLGEPLPERQTAEAD
jgi:hypothetical protein